MPAEGRRPPLTWSEDDISATSHDVYCGRVKLAGRGHTQFLWSMALAGCAGKKVSGTSVGSCRVLAAEAATLFPSLQENLMVLAFCHGVSRLAYDLRATGNAAQLEWDLSPD